MGIRPHAADQQHRLAIVASLLFALGGAEFSRDALWAKAIRWASMTGGDSAMVGTTILELAGVDTQARAQLKVLEGGRPIEGLL
jgi:hypothetical protein